MDKPTSTTSLMYGTDLFGQANIPDIKPNILPSTLFPTIYDPTSTSAFRTFFSTSEHAYGQANRDHTYTQSNIPSYIPIPESSMKLQSPTITGNESGKEQSFWPSNESDTFSNGKITIR